MSAARAKALAVLVLTLLLGIQLSACGEDAGDEGTGQAKAEAKLTAMPSGGRYFSAESPWNTTAQGLPRSSDSQRMLSLARKRRAVIERPGEHGVTTVERTVKRGFQINADRWAPLIVRAGGADAVPTEMSCRQSQCGPEPGRVPEVLALPPGTNPDPRFDGWLSVIDPAAGVGYDFWRARRQSDETISYQYAKAWALDGPGFSPPFSVDPARAAGARGSGMPLFAGVIGPEELRAGEINHALAVSVPGLARRNYVQPASVTDGTGPTNSLPAGARIRLRRSVLPQARIGRASRPAGETTLVCPRRSVLPHARLARPSRPAVEAILVALRSYGAIVVDRAAVPTLYAAQGTPPSLVREDELDWLDLSDFEVVALPELHQDPPLGQVRQIGLSSSTEDRPAGGGG
jgi:hypothetical protein